MNRIKQNHVAATTLAIGLGLASSGAVAMTSEHDIDFNAPGNADRAVIIVDARGAQVVENPNHDRANQLATNIIGGRVGNLERPGSDR